jgi:hypothetical protein
LLLRNHNRNKYFAFVPFFLLNWFQIILKQYFVWFTILNLMLVFIILLEPLVIILKGNIIQSTGQVIPVFWWLSFFHSLLEKIRQLKFVSKFFTGVKRLLFFGYNGTSLVHY